jgi:hypothetical protein
MSKVEVVKNQDTGDTVAYNFYCPGCGHNHAFYVKPFDSQTVWSFNGDMENPTFHPSLLNTWTKPPDTKVIKCCHLFVESGMIKYQGDCTHSLAGKTIDMKEL